MPAVTTAPPGYPAADTAAVAVTPRCVFVTGPAGKDKARWLQETIHTLRADRPAVRCAVLSTDETRAEMERFARAVPQVNVRRLNVPCLCCPAATGLPRQARSLAQESAADWLLVDLPALAATSLLAEFDALVRWPRETVVCLDESWAEARHAGALSFFQERLLADAGRVIAPPARNPAAGRSAGPVPTLIVA